MGDEYVVNKAVCICKLGLAPGILKVMDNTGVYMNGKQTATTMTLGNTFEPPGFGSCKKSWPPIPCVPAITKWTDCYEGVSINGTSYPLLDSSQGTCALGFTNCISIISTGQVEIPGIFQDKKSAAVHCYDINPFSGSFQKEENTKTHSIVTFAKSITEERRTIVSQKTLQILEEAAIKSSNKSVVITSTIRSTRKQAEAMYHNENSGKHIRYRAPGQAVIDVYKEGIRKGYSKEKIIENMDNKIKQLSEQDRRVSLHVVTPDMYKRRNVIDVSTTTFQDAKAFIQELLNNSSVVKIIQPLYESKSFSNSQGAKILYDKGEAAIHIEINQ